MKDQLTLRGYQYVRRSTRRQCLIGLLNQPMTPSQLAQRAGLTTKATCKVVADLREHNLIACLTPGIRRGRPYVRTTRGAAVWALIAGQASPQQKDSVASDSALPSEDQHAYALVCHRHRSTVIRGLGIPRRASQIRHWIRSHLPGARISVNNVRDVLGKLCRLNVVRRVNDEYEHYPVYALTERGERFRDLLDQAMSLPAQPELAGLNISHEPLQSAVVTSGAGGDDE